jgi:hypothetical protein
MNNFLKTALLAISASFLGLTFSTQVRSQVRLDDAEPITLELHALFKLPMGPKGLEVTQKVVDASGQKVRLTGFMVKHEMPTQGAFMLAPRPVQMSEHADGDANDLPASVCWVYLDSSQNKWLVPHIPGPVTVEGYFTFKRVEARDGAVSWFHLQLPPDAISAIHPKNSQVSGQPSHHHSHLH